MILIQWHNVYLTEQGFKLGEGFNREHIAAQNKKEFPNYHETTCVPTEVKDEELEAVN